jgi:uncharacterized protein (TIGR02996 family)
MSAIAALEARLRQHPEDWQSWLVYADWLDDQGDGRAQLVRLEHQLATASLPPPEREALQRQIRLLARANQWDGLWPLQRRPGFLFWRMGFPYEIGLRAERPVPALQKLLEYPHTQFFTNVTLDGVPRRPIASIAERLSSTHVHKLALHSCPLEGADLVRLWKAVRLVHLELFEPQAIPWAEEGAVEALAGLRSLSLSRALTEESCEVLLRSPVLGSLCSLSLHENPIGLSTLERLAPVFARLEALDLSYCWLGDTDVSVLGRLGRLPPSLTLHSNEIGPEGMGKIVRSGALRGVRSLSLDHNPLGDEAAQLLADCEDLQELQSLSLVSARVTARGAEALARSPHLANLQRLDLRPDLV